MADEFDVCLQGTSLKNSLLAAALAWNGVHVLHIDTQQYYGGDLATVPLSEIKDCTIEHLNTAIADVQIDTKRILVDLRPQLVYACGDLVKMLIKCCLSEFIDFHLVPHNFVMLEDQLVAVPQSKEDVFMDVSLTLIGKRKLMRLIEQLRTADSDHAQAHAGAFKQLLEDSGIDARMQQVISSAVVMQQDTDATVGIKLARKYLESTNKYGKSPFLYPLYGLSELPQLFCRQAAVHGATYIMGCSDFAWAGRQATLQVNDMKHVFQVEHIVVEGDIGLCRVLHQGVLVVHGAKWSWSTDIDTEPHSFVVFPPKDELNNAVFAMVLNSTSQMSPQGTSLIRVWSIDGARDLKSIAENILRHCDGAVPLLWAQFNTEESVVDDDRPTFDMDVQVKEAQDKFDKIMLALNRTGQFIPDNVAQRAAEDV